MSDEGDRGLLTAAAHVADDAVAVLFKPLVGQRPESILVCDAVVLHNATLKDPPVIEGECLELLFDCDDSMDIETDSSSPPSRRRAAAPGMAPLRLASAESPKPKRVMWSTEAPEVREVVYHSRVEPRLSSSYRTQSGPYGCSRNDGKRVPTPAAREALTESARAASAHGKGRHPWLGESIPRAADVPQPAGLPWDFPKLPLPFLPREATLEGMPERLPDEGTNPLQGLVEAFTSLFAGQQAVPPSPPATPVDARSGGSTSSATPTDPSHSTEAAARSDWGMAGGEAGSSTGGSGTATSDDAQAALNLLARRVPGACAGGSLSSFVWNPHDRPKR